MNSLQDSGENEENGSTKKTKQRKFLVCPRVIKNYHEKPIKINEKYFSIIFKGFFLRKALERRIYQLDLSWSTNTSLPASIGRLQNLQELNLFWACELTSLPEEIGRLQSLQELNLSVTIRLIRLPEEIGDLRNLVKLNMRNSGIRSFPASIGRLQSLQELDLSGTSLTRLPEEIGDLGNLVNLNLGYSGIQSLPDSIGRLQSLQELNLSGTSRLMSLPEEIGRLQSLQELDLSKITMSRFWEGIEMYPWTNLPEEIGELGNLVKLNLSSENMTSLPLCICRIQSLQELNLSGTKKMKSLPEEIGNLVNLVNLNLAGSDIRSLPASIWRLQHLKYLGLTWSWKLEFTSVTEEISKFLCERAMRHQTLIAATPLKMLPHLLENPLRAFNNTLIWTHDSLPVKLSEHDAVYAVVIHEIRRIFITPNQESHPR